MQCKQSGLESIKILLAWFEDQYEIFSDHILELIASGLFQSFQD